MGQQMAGKRGAKHKVAAAQEQTASAATSAPASTPAVVEVATSRPLVLAQAVVATVASTGTVALPADCRMSTQNSLMGDLLRALDERAIVLDGQAVERIDTAALQLLTLFRREMTTRGGTVSWRGPSVALHEAADLLGLGTLLELPALAPA